MRSLIRRLRDALALVVREIMKFGVVGAVAFVVDIGLFNLLLHAGPEPVLEGKPLTAKGISVACATLVAWLGNRYWTFRRRRRSAAPRELVMFTVVNVGGLVLAWLPLAASRYVLGLSSPLADNIAANVVGLGLGSVFRFVLYRQYVFSTERAAGADGAATATATATAEPSRPDSGAPRDAAPEVLASEPSGAGRGLDGAGPTTVRLGGSGPTAARPSGNGSGVGADEARVTVATGPVPVGQRHDPAPSS